MLSRLSSRFGRGKHESSLNMHGGHSKPPLFCHKHRNERSPFKLIRAVLPEHGNARFRASDIDFLAIYLCQSSGLSVGQSSKSLDLTLDHAVRFGLVVWINHGRSPA